MDRRTFVGGMAVATVTASAAASPTTQNDQAIIDAVEKQREVWAEFNLFDGDMDFEFLEQHGKRFGSTGWTIANTPSDTIVGIKAKAEWLSWPVNYNDGELTAGCANGEAFISLLADIGRIG